MFCLRGDADMTTYACFFPPPPPPPSSPPLPFVMYHHARLYLDYAPHTSIAVFCCTSCQHCSRDVLCCRKLVDKIGTVNKKDIEEVHDVAQLQVIIHLHKDQDTTLYGTGSQLCYHIMGLVHTKWAPIPGSIKDYIATPKTNGYQVGFPAGCAEPAYIL